MGARPLASRGNTHHWALLGGRVAGGDTDHQPMAERVQSVMDCLIAHVTLDGGPDEGDNGSSDG